MSKSGKLIRRSQLRNIFKVLLNKARKKVYSKTFLKNNKKIKYLRLQNLKKFGSVFYKNRQKKRIRILLSLMGNKTKKSKNSYGLVEVAPLDLRFKRKNRNRKYNREVAKKNRDSFFFRKKKKKLSRRKRTRKNGFYSKFPKELTKDQPLTRFYRMNLELLAINYDLLLGFHAAIGNNYKSWINPAVFSKVLAIRNDMILFDLSMIFIKLKKGLQMIFQISKQRGSILGFVDSNRNYKFSGSGFTHFLRSWLGGYLTNYKYVMKNLIALKTKKFMNLTRRQKKFLDSLVTQEEVSIKFYYKFFKVRRKFRKKGIPEDKKKRIPPIPQFGFSLEDHSIWLNESHKIGNSVICICDSESFPQQIDFPIIANSKSLPLSFFIYKIITEGIMCGKRLDYYSFLGFNYVAKFLR